MERSSVYAFILARILLLFNRNIGQRQDHALRADIIRLMANEDNLIPLNQRTKSEQRKIQRNGGIASGKARRKKASLMRCAQRVLEAEIPKEIRGGVQKIIGEIDDEHDELFTAAVAVMAKEALAGNTHAFAQLKDMVQDMDSAYIEDEQEEDDLSRSLRELAEEMDERNM